MSRAGESPPAIPRDLGDLPFRTPSTLYRVLFLRGKTITCRKNRSPADNLQSDILRGSQLSVGATRCSDCSPWPASWWRVLEAPSIVMPTSEDPVLYTWLYPIGKSPRSWRLSTRTLIMPTVIFTPIGMFMIMKTINTRFQKPLLYLFIPSRVATSAYLWGIFPLISVHPSRWNSLRNFLSDRLLEKAISISIPHSSAMLARELPPQPPIHERSLAPL